MCIIFDIYVFILIISVPGYARNPLCALYLIYTWLFQKRVVCIIFDIYVFILIISVPGYARNPLCALYLIFTCLF